MWKLHNFICGLSCEASATSLSEMMCVPHTTRRSKRAPMTRVENFTTPTRTWQPTARFIIVSTTYSRGARTASARSSTTAIRVCAVGFTTDTTLATTLQVSASERRHAKRPCVVVRGLPCVFYCMSTTGAILETLAQEYWRGEREWVSFGKTFGYNFVSLYFRFGQRSAVCLFYG